MTRPIPLEIRDSRLARGRLSLSNSGASSPAQRDAWAASMRKVMDKDGGVEIVERTRLTKRQAGRLTPREIHEAVEAMDLGRLAAKTPAALAMVFERAKLGAMVDRLLQRARADLAESTVRSYEVICGFIEARFGVVRAEARVSGEQWPAITHDTDVCSVASSAAMQWLKEPKTTAGGRPWAPRRQKIAHTVASQLWDYAIADERERAERAGVDPPPLRNIWANDRHGSPVRPAKPRKRRPEALSRSELARILWKARGTPRAAWIAMGAYAGLRRTEMAMLRTDIDVDLEAGYIRIVPRQGEMAWTGPKSDRGIRDVPISRRLRRWLEQHRRLYAGERAFFRLWREDRPLSKTQAARWTARSYEAAGVRYGRRGDGYVTHSLRHTFGTTLARAGVPVPTIARLMGDRMETVLATYLHAFPSDDHGAVEQASKARGLPVERR